NCLGAMLQSARHWLEEEKSTEREYQIEGSYQVRADHDHAERQLVSGLERAAALDGSVAFRRKVDELLALQRSYHVASDRLFAAVDRGDAAATTRIEHEDVDPVFD